MAFTISRFKAVGFFFMGIFLKTVVYTDPPVNLQDLKNKIKAACDNFK